MIKITMSLEEQYDIVKAGKKGVSTPSLKQIEMYLRTCKSKDLTPKSLEELMELTGKEMYNLNSEVYAIAGKASQAQITTIKDIITRMSNAGVPIGMPSDEALSKLTGGKGGTASNLISNLIEKEKSSSDVMNATQGQKEKIVAMFLCPDVDMSDVGISTRIPLEGGFWRKPTTEEMMASMESLTKSEASKFLSKHEVLYYDWMKTRLSQGKRNMIRTLESRLANVANPQEVSISVDMDGNIIETLLGEKEAYVKAYSPLTEDQMLQFDNSEAEEYISMLQSELNRKYPSSLEKVDKHVVKQMTLTDAIYGLFALCGYEDEEVLQAIHEKDQIVLDPAPIQRFINLNLDNESFTEEILLDFGLEEFIA